MVSMQNRWVRIALYCLWRVLLGCMFALKRIPFWLLALVVFILVAYIFWERKGNQLSAFLGLTNRQTLLLGWRPLGCPLRFPFGSGLCGDMGRFWRRWPC